ncbi:MAG: RHS repeat-associated core domain-containing protein, partial [Acidimicrobiia bacterium]
SNLAVVRSFTYDAAKRLTQVTEGAATRRYSYDRNTNRCSTSTSCDASYVYDAADRLTASPFASAHVYDAHGNLTSTIPTTGNPALSLSYDIHDHATVIDDGVKRVEETLAPSGRVLRRVVKDSVTSAVLEDFLVGYDGPGDSPAYERTGSGASPILLADNWTGANGSAWSTSKWTTSTNSSSKTIDVQGNEGRLYVNGDDPRAIATASAVADSEVTLTYRFSDRVGTSSLRTVLRGSGDWPLTSGYRVDVVSDDSDIKVRKLVGGTLTSIGQFSYPKDTNAQRLRFGVEGSSVKAKVWPAGTPEPVAWSIEVTDTSVTGTGKLQLQHNWTSGARSVYVDDLVLTNPSLGRLTTYAGAGTLAVTDANGEPSYAHANGHGDVVGTSDVAGAFVATPRSDEFGKGATPASRLGWLGSQQRYTAHVASGVIRMGVRLYDPTLGRFLQLDPVEGGSANDYDYVRVHRPVSRAM